MDSKKGFAHLILVIVVLLAGILLIGYFAIKNGQINVNDNQSVPSPTHTIFPDTPTPTPDPTADWKTYRNEEYGYSVKYPPVTEPTKYTDNDIYESFTSFVDPNSRDNIRFFTVIVRKSNLDEQVKFEKWQSSHSLVKLVSETKLTVDNLPAIRLDYESVEGYDYEPATFVVVAKDKYAYTISSDPNDMDQILSTFEFLN